jgi:hypothetical protein
MLHGDGDQLTSSVTRPPPRSALKRSSPTSWKGAMSAIQTWRDLQ